MSLIAIRDASAWARTLREIAGFDTYHTHSYHRLAESSGEGEPVLLVYDRNDLSIAIPFLRRTIPGAPRLFDVTSVYGYAGPVANRTQITKEEAKAFREALESYLASENIVSAFTRLHPLLDYQAVLFPDAEPPTPTVVIDLSGPLEGAAEYSKTLRYDIRRLRREGYTTHWGAEPESIGRFREIYYLNMRRVGAAERYFFSEDYFASLFDSEEYDCELALAVKGDAIAAGAIFLGRGEIVQYHLSATDDAHLRLSPIKLVLDEARSRYASAGCRWLHVGGGVGGKDDALLKFKRSFSAQMRDFRVWKRVVDAERYRALVKASGLGENPRFPAYRP